MSEVVFDVVLGVVAVDRLTPANNKILLYTPVNQKSGLPGDLVGDAETSLDAANRILQELTGLEARVGYTGWIEMPQIGLMDIASRFDEETGKRRVSAVYVAAIPEAVELNRNHSVKWAGLEETFSTNLYSDDNEVIKLMLNRI